MSERWYFSLQGELYGPVELSDLKNLLEMGEVRASTMVLKEGGSEWQPLSEVREISMGNEGTYLGEPTRPQTYVLEPSESEPEDLSTSKPFLSPEEVTVTQQTSVSENLRWVLLKGVEEGGKERFLQEGPYSTAEVLQKLQTGEVRYSDHCWRDGMSEWKALRDEPTFAALPDEAGHSAVHLAAALETDIEIPEALPLEDIGSIQFSSTEVHSVVLDEPVPPEVQGADLASAEGEFNFTEDSGINSEPDAAPRKPDFSTETSSLLNKESALMELEKIENSAVKKPITSPLDQIHNPTSVPSVTAEPVKVQQVSSSKQPHLQQKLLEIEMQQSRSQPARGSSLSRMIILLIGTLLLLVFGLQLAKDLAQ